MFFRDFYPQLKLWFKRGLCCALVCQLAVPAVVFGDETSCDLLLQKLRARHERTMGVEGLVKGEKLYGEPPIDFNPDDQTLEDLEISKTLARIRDRIHTNAGHKRFDEYIRHPLLDPKQIQQTQAKIRYIAEHSKDFDIFRKFFSKIATSEEEYLLDRANKKEDLSMAAFAQLQEDKSSLVGDIGGLLQTIFFTTTPWFIHGLPSSIHWAIIAMGTGAGYANVNRRVDPRRRFLNPYRVKMEAARVAMKALSKSDDPELQEMMETLRLIRTVGTESPITRLFGKVYAYINGIVNPDDRELISALKPVDPGTRGLEALYRRLLLLQQPWFLNKIAPLLHLPESVARWIPQVDVNLISSKFDMTHISNFRLRELQALIAEHKDELSKVFSALAQLEIDVAVADDYLEHKERMSFISIADIGEKPHAYLKASHNYQLAHENYSISVPNDIVLGEPPGIDLGRSNSTTVLAGNPDQGGKTFAKQVGQNIYITQLGWPVFAEEGSLTPSLVVTMMSPARGLLGEGQTSADAARWAMIQRLEKLYPYVVVVMNDPFSSAGDLRSIVLRLAMVRDLVQSSTMSLFLSRSRGFLTVIKQWAGAQRLWIRERRVRPFEDDNIGEILNPGDTYDILLKQGVRPDSVEYARQIFDTLSKVVPEDVFEVLNRTISAPKPFETTREALWKRAANLLGFIKNKKSEDSPSPDAPTEDQ